MQSVHILTYEVHLLVELALYDCGHIVGRLLKYREVLVSFFIGPAL